MQGILEALAAGELTPEAAESRLRGYATTDAGRFDAARERRSGVPEAVLGDGKSPAEAADLVATSLETTGRAIATRLDDQHVAATRERLAAAHPAASVETDERAGLLVAHGPDFEPPDLSASVAVVTAGTADAVPAAEAATIAEEMTDQNDGVGAGVDVPDEQGQYVYLLRCADGSLYTGYTTDVRRRIAEHAAGEGAKYTRGRGPVELVHVESFDSRSAAMAREHEIKQLSRAEKVTLVSG